VFNLNHHSCEIIPPSQPDSCLSSSALSIVVMLIICPSTGQHWQTCLDINNLLNYKQIVPHKYWIVSLSIAIYIYISSPPNRSPEWDDDDQHTKLVPVSCRIVKCSVTGVRQTRNWFDQSEFPVLEHWRQNIVSTISDITFISLASTHNVLGPNIDNNENKSIFALFLSNQYLGLRYAI
jgi:hypothetical protein